MSKQKQYLKYPKGWNSKKMVQLPETDDDYLAAGVKEEEAGEKWRAGDAAKSCRFFVRAIEIYASGLTRYPKSFDLAYNKARLQYELSQQPRLLSHQPALLIELLFVALESHRYAFALQTEDADVVFNTAQVMVSIAESLIDNSADVGVHNRSDAVPLLREAINLFKKCLTLQRGQLLEVDDTSITSGRSTADFTPQSHLSTQAETEQRWATVVETITSTTLFDTYLAEAHAWTTLVPLLDPNFPSYQDTESNSMAVLNQAATTISLEEERITYQQATFNLKSILADYAYRSGIIPSIEYIKVVSDLWLSSDQILSFGPGLCDYADALIIMNTSLAFDHTPGIATFRWQALAEALKSLAQANTNSGSADRIAINTRRADVELLRTRLGDPPIFLEQATKNRAVLIKNAETYYLGARRLAQAENDDSTANTMLSKSIIAKALLEENMNQLLAGLSVVDTERLQVVIGEMIEEGLISS